MKTYHKSCPLQLFRHPYHLVEQLIAAFSFRWMLGHDIDACVSKLFFPCTHSSSTQGPIIIFSYKNNGMSTVLTTKVGLKLSKYYVILIWYCKSHMRLGIPYRMIPHQWYSKNNIEIFKQGNITFPNHMVCQLATQLRWPSNFKNRILKYHALKCLHHDLHVVVYTLLCVCCAVML